MKYNGQLLQKGSQGPEVRYIKEALLLLGQYEKHVTSISHDRFRSDTVRAVKRYQNTHIDVKGNRLEADGIVGPLTWDAIVRDYTNKTAAKPMPTTRRIDRNEFPHLKEETIEKLNAAWQGTSNIRVEMMKLALANATDNTDINGFYMWGENLYNKDLAINIATPEKLLAGAKRNPQYYNGGRLEMMLVAVKYGFHAGADCSGMWIGILRRLALITAKTDATANGLCGIGYSQAITRQQLQPADPVGYPGHIGMYLGAGLVCEAAGGAYGIVITKLDNRILYSMVEKKHYMGKPWTRFRRWKFI